MAIMQPRQTGPAAAEADTAQATLPPARMPVDARGLALGVLATLATAFALSWAQTLLVPLLLGIVITYALSPVVCWLERIRIPRVAGSVIVMATVIAALALSAYSLRGQMQTIIEQLPIATAKLSASLAQLRSSHGNPQPHHERARAGFVHNPRLAQCCEPPTGRNVGGLALWPGCRAHRRDCRRRLTATAAACHNHR